MTHKDAPPESPSQIACRIWWQNNQPQVTRSWARDRYGEFMADECRLLHLAWVYANSYPWAYDYVPEKVR